MLDIDSKIFVMHVAIRERENIPIHSKKQVQVGVLLFDKAFIEVLVEYFNYNNFFSVENAAELLENTGMNKHAIELKEGKQPPFSPIYNLGPVQLKTFVMIRSLFLAYHIYGLMIRIASSVSCVRCILFCVVVYVVIAGR